uniref:Uncharacterized protein n=1 Tax=Heterorhabditis bacteriophora TaxID=37862 RepID=A0A1I7WMX2_HETBA
MLMDHRSLTDPKRKRTDLHKMTDEREMEQLRVCRHQFHTQFVAQCRVTLVICETSVYRGKRST